MPIKIKNRDPKKTDFASDEIIINRKDGTLFFKSEKELLKIQGDTVGTVETEITPSNDIFVNNITGSNISASGTITALSSNIVTINGGSF